MLQQTWYKCLFMLLFLLSLNIFLELLLNHMVVSFLIFWGTSILFFIVAVPIHNSTNIAQAFPLSTSTPTFVITSLLDDGHYNCDEVISHYCFTLNFPITTDAHAQLLQLCPTLCDPTRLLCQWDSPGKNTGMGCHFLLQMAIDIEHLCMYLLAICIYSLEKMSIQIFCLFSNWIRASQVVQW